MRYKIGDLVKLNNGCIVQITDVLDDRYEIPVYGTQQGNSEIVPISEDRIIEKLN